MAGAKKWQGEKFEKTPIKNLRHRKKNGRRKHLTDTLLKTED
jgi:hypothetical protein